MIGSIVKGLSGLSRRREGEKEDSVEAVRARRASSAADVEAKRAQYQAEMRAGQEALRQQVGELIRSRTADVAGQAPVRPPAVSPFGNPRGLMAIMRPKVNPEYNPEAPIGQRGTMYQSPEGVKGYFQRLVGNNADELNFAQQQAEMEYQRGIGLEDRRATNALQNAFLSGDYRAVADEYQNRAAEDRADRRSYDSQESQAALAENDRRARAAQAMQRMLFDLEQSNMEWQRGAPERELGREKTQLEIARGRRSLGEVTGPGVINYPDGTAMFPEDEMITDPHTGMLRPTGAKNMRPLQMPPDETQSRVWSPTGEPNVPAPVTQPGVQTDQSGARDVIRQPQSQAQASPAWERMLLNIVNPPRRSQSATPRYFNQGY